MSACPVCGDQRSELYLDGDDDGIRAESLGSSRTLLSHGRILRCTACGLAYRSFRPRDEELAALYRTADDTTYEAESANRLRTALRHRRLGPSGPRDLRQLPQRPHDVESGGTLGGPLAAA